MLRRLGPLLLSLFGLAAATDSTAAAPKRIDLGLVTCDIWNALPVSGVGSFDLDVVRYIDDRKSLPGFALTNRGLVRGTFVFGEPGEDFPIALWGGAPGRRGAKLFTTVSGQHAKFYPEGTTPGAGTGLPATYGWVDTPLLADFDFDRSEAGDVSCVRVDYADASGAVRPIMMDPSMLGMAIDEPKTPVVKSPRSKTTEEILAEAAKNAKDAKAKEPEKSPDKTTEQILKEAAESVRNPPVSGEGGGIAGIIAKTELRGTGKDKEPPKDADGPATVVAAADPDAPVKETPPAITAAACHANDLTAQVPMPMNASGDAGSYTVGWRNAEGRARGFDYVREADATVARDFIVDIADSAGQLLVYDPMMGESSILVEGNAMVVLPVAVPGVDLSQAEPIAPQVKRDATLRVMVVGAPEEIAISGLDLVGATLAKQSKGEVSIAVEWRNVGGNGTVQPAVEFDSFEALVEQARGIAKDKFIVLDEGGFAAFLTGFEKALTGRTAPVDRVIWVKSAYALASNAPKLIEDFIRAGSASRAVPHAPDGRAERWLVVVTARMPGFSLGYLKEPVSSLEAGDVIDEPKDNSTEPRRFIVDPKGLATNLQSLGVMRARAAGKAPAATAEAAVSGALVLDANQIFSERGYVLSPAAVETLVNRLGRLAALWDGPDAGAVNADVLKVLAEEAGKPSPAIADVLQQAEALAGFKLPKAAWIRKPAADLSAEEGRQAQAFVGRLLTAATTLAAGSLKEMQDKPDLGCTLVYVPASDLSLH